ncbi:MAG TPA: hypothetical protein VE819_06255 [Steroidobacteraceae bacterium]|jgi:hypothetical protein|nr:hypothetical protein [Steroidobacteraceae bacterium]
MNVRTNTVQAISARGRRAAVAGALLLTALAASPAHAGPNEQARRIYERIAGVPPSAAELASMAGTINGGCGGSCAPGAAALATAAQTATSSPTFYSVTLKNMVIPWTNRDQTVFAPFNDYAATVIGMVRDDVPFNTALSADILYVVNGVSPAASIADNNHYATAEANGVDLLANLKQTSQSAAYGTPSAATAGLITTRGAESSFFINGTNRAMFRYTMINHFCNDMETLMDTSRPTDRVRQDVARSPGGDSRVFLNTCAGCHSGMDPMAQAFAYYNFNGTAVGDGTNTGTMEYTAGQVQPKYLINSYNFVYGFVTPDDSWSNRWRGGVNASLGWDASLPGYGNGAKSLGMELESSDAFAQCQVVKVFTTVCFRAPLASDQSAISSIKASFKSNGYKLKQVFQQAAAACPGQ